jgi:NAD(P)-dependent dehydrogenase (short-subunit alcohol dehydrogenase family)
MRQYPDSRLVLNAFARRLATVVNSDKIIVNKVCPGMIATDFDKGLPGWMKPIMFIVRKMMTRAVEDGGRTLIYAGATAGPETHGNFF